jgi:hypothetical protein
MKKSVVRKLDGVVINIIEIEEGAVWQPPEGCVLMEGGEIGDKWDGKKWLRGAALDEFTPPPARDLAAELDELRRLVEELRSKKST